MKIAILLVLLGLAKANIQLGTQKRDALFLNAYANYPVLQRVTRAQPAIYPPEKALTWVDDYYERSYAPQPYSFAYDVNDGYNNYGHQQQSDGSVTSGSYRVLLPDGRTQIVNFRADKNGYVADVKYEVSIFKPAGPSQRAPVVAPVYKTNAGQGNKAAWTAFTAYQPAEKPSYKQNLIAALGYKTTPAAPSIPTGKKATIDPQNKTPAAAPAVPSVPAYKPVAAPPAAPTNPAYPAPFVATVPKYRPAANAETKVVPAAPSVQVYRVPVDETNKAPTAYKIPASVPAYRQPAAPEYKTAITPAYQVASAPEYAVPELVYKAPETPSTTYRPTPTTPAYKPREIYTTPYRPPTTTPSVQAVYESSTPASQFRPAWTAFRYAEASTASPYSAPAAYNFQPTTSDYPIAVTTPAYRPPPPAYDASTPAQEESVYEVTTVPAEISTTPSYQNYAAPWTAFRATEAPYQSPAVPSYVPSTTVDSVRYETSTESYLNEAPTPGVVTSVYSDPESSSPTYEQGAAWTEHASVDVPAEETTTYKPDINDVTTTPTRVVYEAPTTPSRAVPSDATRSPWAAGFRPEAPLYYVAPTTYRPLNPPVYKVPDTRTVYESNNGSRTSSSGPAWNAWTAFRSAPVRPVGRPGYEVSTNTTPASKLPPPLVYRNRKA